MQIISTVQAMENESTHWTGQVGLVPTMGYLHAGHASLFQRARAENQVVVASIFVNPTQFAPHEDLDRYPRDLERDLKTLASLGVRLCLYALSHRDVPIWFRNLCRSDGPLSSQSEGAARPGHFRGVATIVLKLFNLIRPHLAYFGQKDAQQCTVIQRMVCDLNLAVRLRVLPTIRSSDGLALSSRNSYLDPTLRAASLIIYQALQAGRATFDAHPSAGPQAVREAMLQTMAREPLARLDYAEVRDATTFLPLTTLQPPALLLIAAHIGSTHLIDNFALHPDGTWDTGTLLSETITH